MTRDEFLEQLRAEVGAAARRDTGPARRRGPLPAVLAAAAVILVVAVGAFLVMGDEPVAAGVEVLRDDRGVLVRLTGTGAPADAIEDAAAAEGLDVTVDEVPVGPSNVGRFVSATGSELPEFVELIDADGTGTARGIRIPFDFEGDVALSVGRPARDDEVWAVASDATRPGELLACEPVHGMDLGDAVQLASSAAGSVRILVRTTGEEVALDALASYPDATVDRIVSPSPDTLWIYAEPEPAGAAGGGTDRSEVPPGC
jgi:hypothetical protein